jgi:hypothetical protein
MRRYELYSWSVQSAWIRLDETSKQHLDEQLSISHRPRELRHLSPALRDAFAPLLVSSKANDPPAASKDGGCGARRGCRAPPRRPMLA